MQGIKKTILSGIELLHFDWESKGVSEEMLRSRLSSSID